jgi:putative transcriptional regulator
MKTKSKPLTPFETKLISRMRGFVSALKEGTEISERFTCRTVKLDLTPSRYTARRVAATREILGASQPVFAQFLGVSVKTVRAWEQGINAPSDMACRFMDEIRRDPAYWQKRLATAALPVRA